MTVTARGACRESLSGCRSCCRTTIGLSGSVGLLSEVTVGLSDRGSGRRWCGGGDGRGLGGLKFCQCSLVLKPPSRPAVKSFGRRLEIYVP